MFSVKKTCLNLTMPSPKLDTDAVVNVWN